MAGINKVILIGNLGQNIELRYTSSGSPVATLSVATSDTWTDKDGQRQEKTEWHRVVLFGKLAEVANQYLKKGSKVYLEGKLQTRKWQDNDGNNRWTTEIMVGGYGGTMQMLDAKNSTATNTDKDDVNEEVPPTSDNKVNKADSTIINEDGGFDDDDIPF